MRASRAIWTATLLSGLVSTPAVADWPPWLERWLFNPAECTERAIGSLGRGDVAGAVEPLETALRLAGDDPRIQYNAGTGRLHAEHGDARSLLEAAADASAGELASLASYNLGNARMAAGDLSGAIDAYQQALRHDPTLQDAKYNLELTRLLLEEQEQEQDPQQQDPQPRDQPQPQPDPRPQDSSPDDREQGSEQEQPQDERQQESPLPQFRDLPDMSAEEAAAILEAVENLEREERQRKAREAAAEHRPGEKDW